MNALLLRFQGWFELRLATDPDPTDEPRGVSGYTFAFGCEPPLDRVLRFQPGDELVRQRPKNSVGSPEFLGVFVTEAVRTRDGSSIDKLCNASINLVGDKLNGEPKLENRNWTLTPPGYEPIVPFNLRITAKQLDLVIARDDPLDAAHPEVPVWELAPSVLARRGASGYNSDPYRVRTATNITDPYGVVKARLKWLEKLPKPNDPGQQAVIDGRISELRFAEANPNDRRVMSRYGVEVFDFPLIEGQGGWVEDCSGNRLDPSVCQEKLGGKLDVQAPWHASFWLGAWDPDLLCGYTEGSFEIPYV